LQFPTLSGLRIVFLTAGALTKALDFVEQSGEILPGICDKLPVRISRWLTVRIDI